MSSSLAKISIINRAHSFRRRALRLSVLQLGGAGDGSPPRGTPAVIGKTQERKFDYRTIPAHFCNLAITRVDDDHAQRSSSDGQQTKLLCLNYN